MANKLFLLECHVGTITFEPTFTPIPSKNRIVINLRFSDILNTEVDPNDFEILEDGEDIPSDAAEPEPEEVVNMDMGTSYLFCYGPHNLINEIKQKNIEAILKIDRRKEATACIKWTDNFKQMIKLFQKIGMVNSVDCNADANFVTKADEVIGKVDVFIRLSCLGHDVETKFHVVTEENQRDFYFKNPKSGITFKCEEYGTRTSMVVPVASLYNPVHRNTVDEENMPSEEENLSWGKVFGQSDNDMKEGSEKRVSVIPLTEIFLQASAETVSLYFRPPENRYLDFLNIVSTEVSATPGETLVTMNQRKIEKQAESEVEIEDVDPLELTAEKINRKLCKNKDCPAAKKFKEFGMGPLATGKGLGTLYGDVEPPAEYGMSHTYGSMSNYGPYGVFSRPKRLDEPFIPPKNALETPCPPCANRKAKTCKEETDDIDSEKKRVSNCVLRLRGGGSMEMAETSAQEIAYDSAQNSVRNSVRDSPRNSSQLGPKSPFLECKSVMDQFDEILTAYKKALGPCGEATCPYAQTMAEESCKKLCDRLTPSEKSDTVSCKSIPCDVRECPYKEKSNYPAGCGSTKCAYTKHKLGLVDDDAALELQYLPPAVSGKCGHPKCKYLFQPPLPPIHWDCPNPLPQGNCKNPDCPFLPPDLKKLKCPPPKKGPCGSPDCPYAIPPPCELPTCPFRAQPCPYQEQQKDKNKKKQEDICANPECPLAQQGESTSSDELDLRGQFTGCASPDCPFSSKPPKPKKKKKKTTGCANPNCPFASKPKPKVCDNPKCPFSPKPKPKKHICGNPDCPFAEQPKEDEDEICDNPDCPLAADRQSKDICDNPECPLAPKPKSKDICDNPECPLAPKPKNKNKDICDNPECPFAENEESEEDENVCDNPQCPLASKKSKKKKVEICENPDCPLNQQSSSSDSVCSNPDCPLAQKKDSICNDPFCPYIQPLPSCGIPNCPYEPIPVVFMDRSKLKNLKCEMKVQSLEPPPPPSNLNITPTEVAAPPQTEVATPRKSIQKETNDSEKQKATDKQKRASTESKKSLKEKSKPKIDGNGNGKRKNRGKFVYSIGDKYPGVKIGHKECVCPLFRVPAKMGWLWNIHDPPILSLKPRRGWKPGALTKLIAGRIKAHRQSKGLGMVDAPKFKKKKGAGGQDSSDSENEVTVSPKPTLQIQKKDGAYWITMNPLKDPNTLAETESPYMECTPMQFRITKNKKRDDENESRLCCCEDENESSSSSDSELDIEFTPPAGIINPLRFKKKKNVIHCDTQYDPKDFQKKKKGKDKGKGGKGKKDGKGKKGKK